MGGEQMPGWGAGGGGAQATSSCPKDPQLETQTPLSCQEARNTQVRSGEDKG